MRTLFHNKLMAPTGFTHLPNFKDHVTLIHKTIREKLGRFYDLYDLQVYLEDDNQSCCNCQSGIFRINYCLESTELIFKEDLPSSQDESPQYFCPNCLLIGMEKTEPTAANDFDLSVLNSTFGPIPESQIGTTLIWLGVNGRKVLLTNN